MRFSLAAAANTGVVGTTGDLFGAPDGVFLAPNNDYLESDDDAPSDGDDVDSCTSNFAARGWQCVDEQPERPKFLWSLSMPSLSMHTFVMPTFSTPFACSVLLTAILFGMLQAVATEAVESVGFAALAQTGVEKAYWFPTKNVNASKALMTSGTTLASPSVTEVNAFATPIKFGTTLAWPAVTENSMTIMKFGTTMATQTGIEEAYWSLTKASDGADQVLSDGGDGAQELHYGAQELRNHTALAGATEAKTKSSTDWSSMTEASATETLTKSSTDWSFTTEASATETLMKPSITLDWPSAKEASASEALTKSSTTLDERCGGALGEHDTRFADPNPPLKSGGWYRSSVVVLKDERRGGILGEYDTRFAKWCGGTLGEYNTRLTDPSLKSGGLYRLAIEPLMMGASAIMALILFRREKQRAFQNNEGTNAGISVVCSEAVT